MHILAPLTTRARACIPRRRPALALAMAAAAVWSLMPASSVAEEPLPNVDRLKTSPVLQSLQPNPLRAPARTAPEQTVARMYLPPGFRAELVAAEPDLHQPVAFAFDERGRLWVAEAYSYPNKRPAGEGLDKIVILEDGDGDGRFETRKEFAERLNLVSGLEVGHGGVWVGAAPELLFIPDRNHDDVPDGPPQVLLDGFGFQDTHECLNSFVWGPDGWLYGNQGVFNFARIGKPGAPDRQRTELRAGVWRYHPVRHEFEVFAEGGSNQWGLDYDERGQLFMTHCRSYYGRGPTTHVIQGGHYWNQANANHAPFIIPNPPPDFPGFRNYLLASARYDHGAGGAGKPGSDAIYGGHSHVGTMIYLGDNWPDEFRGHLFTHNLHGHQINHQVNRPLGSGFDTVHAGQDIFFCTDPKYVAVDLQYGPDGAVYVIDWYDQQHCHNPNTERWDRSNGRIYRLQYDPTYRPRKVDLGSLSDERLTDLLTRKNEWDVRTARRLLHERAAAGKRVRASAIRSVEQLARQSSDPLLRLRGLWTLHALGRFTEREANRLLDDADPHVRAWSIRLATESRSTPTALLERFVQLAQADPSPVVRLQLASALQRVPDDTAWPMIDALSRHGEDAEDRNIPLMVWAGLAPRLASRLPQAFALARETRLPALSDFIHWYAATMEGEPLNLAILKLRDMTGDYLGRRLAGLELAMKSRANVPMPAGWKEVAPRLYSHPDPKVNRSAERLAAVFGDDSLFPRLRSELADPRELPAVRQHAFAVLSRAQDPASIPTFLQLVNDAAFRSTVIPLLARFDRPEIASALLRELPGLSQNDRAAALIALTSRPSYALPLLEAVAAGTVKRDQLNAFHIRQMTQLRNPEVDRRLATTWGRLQQSPAEKVALIGKLEKTFTEAPLWAFSAREGRRHFQRLCTSCHRLGGEGTLLGPDLTGAGKNGIRYFLENVVDPNAVIGTDFQMTTLETRQGDLVAGLLTAETPSAVTLRTTTGESVVAKSDIASRLTSEKSLMPEGLLESLTEREQIELLLFLISN